MKFYLTPYTESHGIEYTKEREYPHIEVITDAWDDYFQYETLFRLKFAKTKNEAKYLGQVKIMKKGANITRNHIESCFEGLGEEFCSLGQDVDYYRNLRENFNKTTLVEILTALRDTSMYPEIYQEFKSYGAFNDSLLRFSEAYRALNQGKSIIEGTEYENTFKFKYKYKFDESNQEYEIGFDFEKVEYLPYRMNVLVGKNGAGKTNLLANLSSNLSGLQKNKGEIDAEARPNFSKYIVISYNLFDDFNKPFEVDKDLEQYDKLYNELEYLEKNLEIIKMMQKLDEEDKELVDKEIGYIETEIDGLKAGLGDKYKKVKDKIERLEIDYNVLFSYVYCGLRTRKGLITLDEMKENLKKSIKVIEKRGWLEKWKEILAEIMEDGRALDNILSKLATSDMESLFSKLSSGQSILICVISSIIEHIEEESLLIFDEPEVHLHPNAICSFMKMFNKLLTEFDSYAIIATHSPLIIQEVPSRCVRVFSKQGDGVTDVELLDKECFGENISNITNYIFDITEVQNNYKVYLKDMVEKGLSKEEITALFENDLSYNALVYLNYLYNKKGCM